MSAIAASQPEPPSKIQPAIPAALDNVVEVCLAKDPDERWQTARDLLAQLQWVSDSVGAVGEAQARQRAALSHDRPGRSQKTSAWWLRVGVASAAVLLLAVAVPAFMYFRGSPRPDEIRFHTVLGATFGPGVSYAAVSPNGSWIVYFNSANE